MEGITPITDRQDDEDDRALAARAAGGEDAALEQLVRRHQAWIYNLALRMLGHPHDAEDATQEILVRALGSLASFEGRSRFRTWLYRIAVNHLLNTTRSRRRADPLTFGCYAHGLDSTPDLDPPDPGTVPADVQVLVAEARIGCTMGMLLCLEREQRIAYILGEIFGVPDTLGAELLEVAPAAYRQRLARARRDLHAFMNDKCGLVSPANPCRCARKTRGFVQAGWIDPTSLVFTRARLQAVRDAAPAAAAGLSALDRRCGEIFREHPFYAAPDIVPRLRRLLAGAGLTQAITPGPPDRQP